MFELKIRTLVCCDSSLEPHTFFQLEKGCSCFTDSCADICISATLFIDDAPELGEGPHLLQQARLVLPWLRSVSLSSFSACGWQGPLGTRCQQALWSYPAFVEEYGTVKPSRLQNRGRQAVSTVSTVFRFFSAQWSSS